MPASPRAPFIDDPHLYPPSPRRDTYGSMASAAIGNPRPAHVAAFFDRNDHTSPGRRPRSIQGNVTFPASTRRRSKTCRDPFAASSMTAQSRCSSTSLPRDGQSRPPFQPPEPFTPIPKSIPNGFYAKKLLGSFEHFRMRDALAFAEQSCRSGHHLEFRYTQSILREGVSHKFGHLRFRERRQ